MLNIPRCFLTLLTFATFFSGASQAVDYPTKPIRLIAAY